MRQDLTLCTENYYQITEKLAHNIIYDFLLLCRSNLKGKFRICDFFLLVLTRLTFCESFLASTWNFEAIYRYKNDLLKDDIFLVVSFFVNFLSNFLGEG
jgi:hypothetical protein